MELLAAARNQTQLVALRRALAATTMLAVGDAAAYETAAAVAQACRDGGEQLSGHLDCLIAAVALRENVPILHRNRDFEAIARHTPLRVA
jgi:predicted nucleic acid-binding protein